jgi:phosphate butyryltransferase
MNEAGEIKGCIIGGPLALDNIVSKAAAELKGIDHPVAGDADIIVVPDLVSGNTLYKSMAFLSKVKSAGVIQGAKVPIVVTSRADSEEDKLYSIALAALVAKFKKAGAIS